MNAGKKCITAIPGASYFHHADSFSMIRGGHIDICILGAMQISKDGDLANWSTGNKNAIPAVGGAMDLVASADNIIVAMMHANKRGESKLLKECSLPLTGVGCVKKVVTNLAVMDILPEGGFKLLERSPGVSVEDIQAATEGKLIVEGEIPEMKI